MSVCIQKKLIPKELNKKIADELTFTPKSSSQFILGPKFKVEAPEKIKLWISTPEYAYLPFSYGWEAVSKYNLEIIHSSHRRICCKFEGDLLPHQGPIIERAKKQLVNTGCVTVNIPPGKGKTVIGAYLACTYRKLTLIISPRKILSPSWLNTFTKFTDAKVWVVGTKWDDDNPPDVIISVNKSVDKIPEDLRERIGMVIYDEYHLLLTPDGVEHLLKCTPAYVIGLTATYNRSDGMIVMGDYITGSELIQMDTPPDPSQVYTIYTKTHGVKPPELINFRTKKTDWTKLQKWLVESEERNNLIVDLVCKMKTRKILILCWTKDHVLTLLKKLKEKGEEADYLMGAKESYVDSRILIGTVSKISTGFDESSFSTGFKGERLNTLIMCASTKNMDLLEQSVGRVFRSTDPWIFHLIDEHKTCTNHWKLAQSWYRKHNGIFRSEDNLNEVFPS